MRNGPRGPSTQYRKLVGVAVGRVEEPAFLHGQAQRVLRRAALVEAERAGAGQCRLHAHRLRDMGALGGLRHVAIVDPAQAVAGDFPARLAHRGSGVRIAAQGHRLGEDGERQVALGEQAPEPPEADAAAVFVEALHVHVALAGPGRRAHDLGQERLRGRVAVEDAVLAALLVVQHELHRDPGLARPARVGRGAAVAEHVARIGLAHRRSPRPAGPFMPPL